MTTARKKTAAVSVPVNETTGSSPILIPSTRDQAAQPASVKFLLTLDEAAFALGLSRRSVETLIKCGRLKSVRYGVRRLIRLDDLREFVDSLPVDNLTEEADDEDEQER